MKDITGYPKSLKDLLLNTKYTIRYYQREYRWQRKNIEELIDDLTTEFLSNYNIGDSRKDVDHYGIYFMGSIVLAGRENAIIDGQQRLTSLTLLLIYLKNRLKQLGLKEETIDGMIFSQSHGIKSFNIHIEDRVDCMDALYNDKEYDADNQNESIKNIYNRYNDIVDVFPTKITDEMLLHFCDWIMDKVYFIEIVATTEQDAHKIFVTMNDRGLSLTPTEMLKGFILSEITDDKQRETLNDIWKEKVLKLKEQDPKGDEVFIKNWLRAQYAETIRETKAGAVNKDFDIIGGPFHKWVSDSKNILNLNNSEDYEQLIKHFSKFADVYTLIKDAETRYQDDLKYVYYNAQLNFTFQPQLLLAPIKYEDTKETIKEKINLVARFIDLFIVNRVSNFKSVDYSTIKNYIFIVTKDIRNTDIEQLKAKLLEHTKAYIYQATPDVLQLLEVNGYTKKYIKHMLARITGFIEEKTDVKSNYIDYVDTNTKNPFEVEHIITDHYEWFTNEYTDQNDFKTWRNKLGAVLLLRKSINSSLQDALYDYKLTKYCSNEGNIYTESLGEIAYKNNPRFKKFIQEYNLPFEPYSKFGKDEILKRTNLFIELFKLVWNTNDFEN